MNADVAQYFQEQYAKSNVRVVPGHWPDFKSKQAVDDWISFLQKVASEMNG